MIPGFLRIEGEDPQQSDQRQRLFRSSVPMLEQVATTVPTVDTLPPGFLQRYDDGTNRRVYMNMNDVIYYWALTAA